MKALVLIILSLLTLFPTSFLIKVQSQQTGQMEVYKPGEMLQYEMSYGWIKGGEASLSLQQVK